MNRKTYQILITGYEENKASDELTQVGGTLHWVVREGLC